MLTCAYLLLVLVVGFLLEISHIFNKNDEIMNAVGLKDLVSIFYVSPFWCLLEVIGNDFETTSITKFSQFFNSLQ